LTTAAEGVYDAHEAAAIARLVAERRYGLSRAEVALEPFAEVAVENHPGTACHPSNGGEPANAPNNTFNFQLSTFNSILADIAAARPVQYILGVADFYGLEFEVGEGVLVPRPETEELVHFIIKNYELRIKNGLRANILDIGTGSGAIAIALAKNLPQARVTAIDISGEALEYARRNSEKHSAGVTFYKADILQPDNNSQFSNREALDQKSRILNSQLDIIVSNPPYIPAAERAAMADNVVRYEPAGALFVPDDDPLLFYRRIAKFARRYLHSRGALYFEIHETMGEEMREMLAAEGFSDIELREDINSKPRMMRCRR
jgi:release factor glutamine methyltransferase